MHNFTEKAVLIIFYCLTSGLDHKIPGSNGGHALGMANRIYCIFVYMYAPFTQKAAFDYLRSSNILCMQTLKCQGLNGGHALGLANRIYCFFRKCPIYGKSCIVCWHYDWISQSQSMAAFMLGHLGLKVCPWCYTTHKIVKCIAFSVKAPFYGKSCIW